MKNVVYSFLGTTLDELRKKKSDRWGYWRPSVSLAMQPDIHFDEYHLWYSESFLSLAERIERDISLVSPDTKVFLDRLDLTNPWDFEEVFAKLYDYSRLQKFDVEKNRYYVHITTGTHVAQICLFLLAESRHIPGVLIQTRPSSDRKNPAGCASVIDLNLAKYDLLAKRFSVKCCEDLSFLKAGIETRNTAFNVLIEKIERVSRVSREPILLTGPTGAGKSRLARKIYELKRMDRQVSGAFVDVNCATLKGEQAMAALFGHTKGAFTGALKERAGLLKTADGGMLFLDEVGELGLDEQAMLLRAIEEKSFLPLGADVEEQSDFQLICGTNRNLQEAVAAGRFREDLFQRINLWTFRLPGLSERTEDIEPNVDYELQEFTKKNGRSVSFSSEALALFMKFARQYPWKGNFRELNAMMTRMATMAPGGRIDVATVQNELNDIGKAEFGKGDEDGKGDELKILGDDYERQYDSFDLAQLKEVVRVCRSAKNMSEAGRRLFAVSRLARKSVNDADRLARYLARFGLSFQKIQRG